MPTRQYEIVPFGDSGFLVKYQIEEYSEKVTQHINAVIEKLRRQEHWEELVPGYNSLLAYFCPHNYAPTKAKAALEKTLKSEEKSKEVSGRLVEVPVCYGGEFGPDMKTIESSSGLSVKDIIKRHSQPTYTVCMMGFIPGFSYLSAVAEELRHPRLSTPRLSVPSGSVGIAGWQTGIYGLESPGGWQIIGRTNLQIFDATRSEPFMLRTGDRVKFKPVQADAIK